MSKAPTPRNHLTTDMIIKINDAVDEVSERSGYGQVIINIEKGVPRWINPAPSLPLSPCALQQPQRRGT